jgi:hypothetical protein
MKKDTSFKELSLLTTTRELLLAQPARASVARACGLHLNWLEKFAAGKFKDPSVNRVQALYEHLSGKKLEL